MIFIILNMVSQSWMSFIFLLSNTVSDSHRCLICSLRTTYLPLVITLVLCWPLKRCMYRCFCWFDTAQISPTPAVVNPNDNFPPAGQVRGPAQGKLSLHNETKSPFSSPPVLCQSIQMRRNRNVQECLIWLQPFWRGRHKKGERRLACHCIIPAAINSLCPEAEWTHHSNGPQAEWHRAPLNQRLAPPCHTSRFKQTKKATGV